MSGIYLKIWLPIAISCVLFTGTSAWDNDDFEIFDLVEEINENFYKMLKIEQVSHLNYLFTLCELN